VLARVAAVVILFHTSMASVWATEDSATFVPAPRSKLVWMREHTYGKEAVIRLGATALYSHVLNRPHEWGRGIGGFGKRVGSGFGILVIKNSIQGTVGYIRHEEFGYRASDKVGFRPRLTYALLSTVITRDTRTHKQTMSAGKLSGVVGSGLISRLWQPMRLRTVSSGFSSAGISLGVDAGTNVIREFWPEIRRRKRTPPRESAKVISRR
jgi:hypothetical protein